MGSVLSILGIIAVGFIVIPRLVMGAVNVVRAFLRENDRFD